MRLPIEMQERLTEVVEPMGAGRVLGAEPVGGGCITETGRLVTAEGANLFLKWSADGSAPAGLFAEEARSLRALADAKAMRVPDVVDIEDEAEGDGPRWLLLEWLEPGRPAPHTWAALGQGLCALHRKRAPEPGWPSDNFIGTLPQQNGPAASWADFWRARRLEPQLRRAADAGLLDQGERRRFDALSAALDDILAPAETDGFSLLHGDLWAGNLHVQQDGDPALIDPCSYHGHREVDLAMTELFGGFDVMFGAAYSEAWPLQPGFEKTRRAVYQLYYLLVHVNLFGAGYRSRTLAALGSVGF